MAKFSEASEKMLATCHPKLRELMHEVIKGIDCKIICGFRGQDEQERAFEQGFSKAHFGESKHNIYPSEAVDVAPYPLDWKDERRFYVLGGYIKATADRLGIKIRQGLDWDGDMNLKDQNFHDLPHVELLQEPTSTGN